MTDRVSGFVVMLAEDMREDDAESTVAALRHIKGVISVEPVIDVPSAMIERTRILRLVTDRLRGVIEEIR